VSESTGLVLAIGGITLANEALFAPLAGHGTPWKDINWRILPATAILAGALALVDKLSPDVGRGIAIIALVTVLFAQVGSAPAPLENLAQIMGEKSG
jgi:hypothetical protein